MAEEQALVQLMDTLDGLELTKSEYEWLEQRFAAMTEKEQFLFRGAMKLEKPETASGAISIASQLHCYELFYSAGDEDALGQFVMKHLEQVPDVARPYLSPAYVGQMFQQEGASGVFSPWPCSAHTCPKSMAWRTSSLAESYWERISISWGRQQSTSKAMHSLRLSACIASRPKSSSSG